MNHDDPASQHNADDSLHPATEAVNAVERNPVESLRRLKLICALAATNPRHPKVARLAWADAHAYVLTELRKHDPDAE